MSSPFADTTNVGGSKMALRRRPSKGTATKNLAPKAWLSAIEDRGGAATSALSSSTSAAAGVAAAHASGLFKCECGTTLRTCAIHRPEDVDDLNLSSRRPPLRAPDLRGLASMAFALRNLQRLSLPFNKIAHLDALDALTSLTFLNVSHNRVASVAGVRGLPRLRVLRASHNALASLADFKPGPGGAGSAFAALEELWLSRNPLPALDELRHLRGLPGLARPASAHPPGARPWP